MLVVIAVYGVARLLAYRLEPRLEQKVRLIKGKPKLLRLMVALLRTMQWLIFSLLLWLIYDMMQQLTWPSHSYFIGIVARLSSAWIAIAILSKMIRNRSLSRVVAMTCWVFATLGMLGLLDNARTALNSVAFTVGDFHLSLLKLIEVLLLVVGSLWVASSLGRFVDRQILKIDDLTPSLKVLIGKMIKIFLYIIAVVIAVSSTGIDLTVLTIFSGAVGVGIGFGLQKVVSNFISGIIILLDKSIKPGDTISVGDTFGWIRELRARFVSVITRDGKEYLIPNEDFITQQVINWSFTDQLIRLDVPFGVSYDSDPHQVSRLAIAACAAVTHTPNGKPPACWMTEFGDSSINFVLRFWIMDPKNGLTNIRGRVLLALWDSFKENGIDIPFPHREVIIKTPLSLD